MKTKIKTIICLSFTFAILFFSSVCESSEYTVNKTNLIKFVEGKCPDINGEFTVKELVHFLECEVGYPNRIDTKNREMKLTYRMAELNDVAISCREMTLFTDNKMHEEVPFNDIVHFLDRINYPPRGSVSCYLNEGSDIWHKRKRSDFCKKSITIHKLSNGKFAYIPKDIVKELPKDKEFSNTYDGLFWVFDKKPGKIIDIEELPQQLKGIYMGIAYKNKSKKLPRFSYMLAAESNDYERKSEFGFYFDIDEKSLLEAKENILGLSRCKH